MRTFRVMIAPLLVMAAIVGVPACASPPPLPLPTEAERAPEGSEASAPARELAPFTQTISGSTVSFDMRPIPAGRAAVGSAGGGETGDGGQREVEVAAFWIAETETTWDLYDIFMYELDNPDREAHPEADAVSRPSRPYIPPDRGFGHAGYPAISMTRQGAEAFCEWLSAKTGRRYRLPTEAEWVHAAGAGVGEGAGGRWFFGDDVAQLDEFAWHAHNSGDTTHPVGEKGANPHGLRDVYGNAAEWIAAGEGQRPSVMGGSFIDEPEDCATRSRREQDRSWNVTDPQIPKSPWWLSDGAFVGFRVVCEVGGVAREERGERREDGE